MLGMDPHTGHERSVIPEGLEPALDRVAHAPVALLGLGIPRCPATLLLPASLSALTAVRPDLPIALAILSRPEDWAARETLLWPRGIRIGRSIVPVLVLLRNGHAAAIRRGGAPAYVIDAWLTEDLGPGASRLDDDLTATEERDLVRLAARRAQHAALSGWGAAL
jgi:hypothetical protein